jgi:hypothetical protein
MIYTVQVFPNDIANCCCIRIGKTHDISQLLNSTDCHYIYAYTVEDIKNAINTVKKLPDYYREKNVSINKLKLYLAIFKDSDNPKYRQWGAVKKIIEDTYGQTVVYYD